MTFPVQPTHGHLDGDLLVFQCCAAAEYNHDPADVNFDNIARTIQNKILGIKRALKLETMTVFFSSSKNYRHVLTKGNYKLNRDETWEASDGRVFGDLEVARKHQRALGVPHELKHSEANWRPYHLKNGVAYVKAIFHCVEIEGLEADDLLKIYQKPDGSTVLITQDKDLLQCAGSHFRWETGDQGEVRVFVEGSGKLELTLKADTSTDKGRRAVALATKKTPQFIHIESKVKTPKKEVKGNGPLWFLYQCLVGDPTDGIMGCGKRIRYTVRSGAKAGTQAFKRDGVGPIEAYEVLQHCDTYAEGLVAVAEKYKEVFGSEWLEQLTLQGRLVYMVKTMVGSRVLMWHPLGKKEWYDLETRSLCMDT